MYDDHLHQTDLADSLGFAVGERKEERLKMKYVDLHCDTLTCGKWLKGEEAKLPFLHRNITQISLEKLKKGGCYAQVFGLFSRSKIEGAWNFTVEKTEEFLSVKSEIEKAGIVPILAIEDGGSIEGDLKRLSYLIKKGVRIFGIAWNDENCLGYSCWQEGGLKPFGKEVVSRLLEEKVYPDISHLSSLGVADVLAMAREKRFPVIATHSLAKKVCPHRRNLTDEEIKKIADLGGIIGVNFAPDFIGEKGIFAHIKHIKNVGGEEVLAIGTDFDGIENPVYSSAEEMPRFFEDMEREGFSASTIEKLAYKNAERLLL